MVSTCIAITRMLTTAWVFAATGTIADGRGLPLPVFGQAPETASDAAPGPLLDQLSPLNQLRVIMGLFVVIILGIFLFIVVKAGAHMVKGLSAPANRLRSDSAPAPDDWAQKPLNETFAATGEIAGESSLKPADDESQTSSEETFREDDDAEPEAK